MLRELFESRPARRTQSRAVAASAVAHGIIIAGVLMATRGTNSHAHTWNGAILERSPTIRVQYMTSMPDRLALRDPSPAETRTAQPVRNSSMHEFQRAKARLASLKASLAELNDRLGAVMPTIGLGDVTRGLDTADAKWTAVSDSEFNDGQERLSDGVRPLVSQAKDGIYTPDMVDEAATPQSGNPKPRYPESLLAAGIEAEVNVMFVVDTTGRVDEPSIKFTSHVHELFMDAIKTSLRRARFFPARFAGMVVPQLVQQNFRFEIRRR